MTSPNQAATVKPYSLWLSVCWRPRSVAIGGTWIRQVVQFDIHPCHNSRYGLAKNNRAHDRRRQRQGPPDQRPQEVKLRVKYLLSILVPSLLLVGAGAASTKLRIAPEIGTTYRYILTQSQTGTTSMGAMGSQEMDSETRTNMSMTALERDDDGATTFEMKYERFRTRTTGPVSTEFDSDQIAEDDSGLTANPMTNLIGKTFQIRLSPRGEILEVTGLREIFEELRAELQAQASSAAIEDMIGRMLDEEAITAMFRQLSPVFPEETIEKGSTWSAELRISVPMIGPMKVALDYRVDDFESKKGRDSVRVAFVSTMEIEGESPIVAQLRETIQQQGSDAEVDWTMAKSTGSGTMWIDRATGMPVAMTAKQNMNMHMTLSLNPEYQTNTMDMEMNFTQNQVLELVD